MTGRTTALLPVALVCMVLMACQNPDAVERDLRAQIQQEVPIGSGREQVIAFLRRHRIEQLRYHEKRRAIYANIPRVAPFTWLTLQADIRLQFNFDEKEQLTSYEAKQVFIGP